MAIKIRTPRDKGDYCDYTKTGPGLTDQSQHETLTDLVARVLRGEVVTKNQLIYDFDEKCKLSEEEQFAAEDVTQTDGFDLADTQPILEAINSELKQGENTSAPDGESKEEASAPTQSNEADEKDSE